MILLIAWLGGVLTVLSPCVLPVLPVLLSAAVGGPARPLGVITGFIGSFVLVTLFLARAVTALNLSPDALRGVATALLLAFGLTLALPAAQGWFERVVSRILPHRPVRDRDGFGGGLLLGATLGVVWTPCVGPILASVTTLALSGQVTGFAVAATLAYALGVALPMLAVMRWGRRALHRPALLGRLGTLQRAFGVLLALFAVGMVFGVDRRVQTALVDGIPALQRLTFLEETDAVQRQLPTPP